MSGALALDTPGAPAPRGEARRERIVEAALAVIAEIGPDALTHRRVATRAGVPLAATTYWFASKEELIREAFELAATRDLERLAERADAAATWTRATIARKIARSLHEQLIEHRATALVDYSLWMEAARRPELHAVAERWSEAYVAFYTVALQRLDATVEPDDGRLFSVAVQGLFGQQLARDEPAGERRLTRLLERLVAAFVDA